ncbi:MAG: AAA family ATPase [Candidatus Pacebacteria bacterium]|nr:AAA family ATPase [Candidatus Paceibacterota bacterium]
MTRKQIITISGKPGSGKSSTAAEVAKLLNYEHHSAGKIMRQMAEENSMSLAEINKFAKDNPEVDKKIDTYLQSLGERDGIVIDSRIAFHWIPHSFKVYLELDSDIAAARIFKDMQSNRDRKGEIAMTIDAVWAQMQDRMMNEKRRYQKLYNVNPYARKNFDLIIHTERNNPLTVSLWILDRYKQWLKTSSWRQVVEKVPLGFSIK